MTFSDCGGPWKISTGTSRGTICWNNGWDARDAGSRPRTLRLIHLIWQWNRLVSGGRSRGHFPGLFVRLNSGFSWSFLIKLGARHRIFLLINRIKRLLESWTARSQKAAIFRCGRLISRVIVGAVFGAVELRALPIYTLRRAALHLWRFWRRRGLWILFNNIFLIFTWFVTQTRLLTVRLFSLLRYKHFLVFVWLICAAVTIWIWTHMWW